MPLSENVIYQVTHAGEVAGSVTAAQLPDIDCRLVKIKAHPDNSAYVYIGGSSVTVADGTTDTNSGFPLAAGEETGWVPVNNLDVFYYICDDAGDSLSYLVLA